MLAVAILLGWLMASDRLATTLAQDKPGAADPLPSWNDSLSKKAIIEFVTLVTTPNASGSGRKDLHAPVPHAEVNLRRSAFSSGPLDRRAQANLRKLLRSDTPRSM